MPLPLPLRDCCARKSLMFCFLFFFKLAEAFQLARFQLKLLPSSKPRCTFALFMKNQDRKIACCTTRTPFVVFQFSVATQ